MYVYVRVRTSKINDAACPKSQTGFFSFFSFLSINAAISISDGRGQLLYGIYLSTDTSISIQPAGKMNYILSSYSRNVFTKELAGEMSRRLTGPLVSSPFLRFFFFFSTGRSLWRDQN